MCSFSMTEFSKAYSLLAQEDDLGLTLYFSSPISSAALFLLMWNELRDHNLGARCAAYHLDFKFLLKGMI